MAHCLAHRGLALERFAETLRANFQLKALCTHAQIFEVASQFGKSLGAELGIADAGSGIISEYLRKAGVA
ncbi:MAG: hypothetical protein EAZ42_08640 [Verrucomicrobia bacterium]|nr:MAG: hypothetical protein EAZ42_08640 [Verrucomicrobiota bacterium]